MYHKADPKLYNLYYQYWLFKENSNRLKIKNSKESKLLSRLKELPTDASLEELSKATDIPEEEFIKRYREGERDSIRSESTVAELIIVTRGFADFLKSLINLTVGKDTVTGNSVEIYLAYFRQQYKNWLRDTQLGGKQYIERLLVTGIENKVAPMGSSFRDERDQLRRLAIEINNLSSVSPLIKNRRAGELKENINIELRPFFNLVTEFNELQGTCKIAGVETLMRSLIDVLAYLTDDDINRYHSYEINQEKGIVLTDAEDKDTYKYRHGSDDNLISSVFYMKSKKTDYLDARGLYGCNYIQLNTMYGSTGDRDPDKIAKRMTYHRLVDLLLNTGRKSLKERISMLVNGSIMLTRPKGKASTNSNTPLISSYGYVNIDTINFCNSNARAYLESLTFTIRSGDFEFQGIPNDESMSKMLKISNLYEIVEELRVKMEKYSIDWISLKTIYNEYKDSLIQDYKFNDVHKLYKSARFFKRKDKLKTFLHSESIDKDEEVQLQNIVDISERLPFIYALYYLTEEEIVKAFFNNDKDTGFPELTEDFSDKMHKVFEKQCQLTSYIDCIEELTRSAVALLDLADIISEYQASISVSKKVNDKNTIKYALYIAYDHYAMSFNRSLDMFYSVKLFEPIDNEDEFSVLASRLLNAFKSKSKITVPYLLQQSMRIRYNGRLTPKEITEKIEDLIERNANSRQILNLKSLANGYSSWAVPINGYSIDDYGLYRASWSKEYRIRETVIDPYTTEYSVEGVLTGLTVIAKGDIWEIKSI